MLASFSKTWINVYLYKSWRYKANTRAYYHESNLFEQGTTSSREQSRVRDLSEKISDEQRAYCQLDYTNRRSIRNDWTGLLFWSSKRRVSPLVLSQSNELGRVRVERDPILALLRRRRLNPMLLLCFHFAATATDCNSPNAKRMWALL